MAKRILLFLLTNVLIIVTLSIILSLLGVTRYITARGIDYSALIAFCLVWGMGGAFISLALSRIMAKAFMGVQLITGTEGGSYTTLYEIVRKLQTQAGLSVMPQVGVYDSPEINAFATGPTKNRALVAVSSGLLQKMDRNQIEGVLGHELAHIANGDMVTMTLIQGVINAFVMFLARVIAFAVSTFLSRSDDGERVNPMLNWILVSVFEIVFSLLGAIVVAWFSRHREFRADAGGAKYAGRNNMIGALKVLQAVYEDNTKHAEKNVSVATLKISGKRSGFLALFSTHPPLEERISRLEQYIGQ